ncbi:amidohydrolase family protein [Erythrobacter sp.]|uniref:amidohydrolase family protein n=1 Tax=Erythrobacter sp. TaxID=1042 RepID=UPI001B19BEDF|nr:amidohydrolase family protein [Erythrobacter sp.]MBO6527704.1 amidohydrolase family protein [Erythrobacter sp.]MBO6530041.1 amidohydrolase family protein [Erythrobacter sp.]
MTRALNALALGTAGLLALATTNPAAAQDVAITNATVATGDGSEPIDGATVVVRGGEVVAAGRGIAVPAGIPVLDGTGAWVTPGIFATVTTLGLWDVGAVSQSNDTRAGNSPFSAALDAAPIVNPASQHVSIHRAAGVTRATTVTMPSSSIFGGQGAVIDLGADPNAVTRPRAFQVVALGEYGARLAGGSRAGTHALFRNALREASTLGTQARIPGSSTRRDIRTGDDVPLDPRLAGRDTQRSDDVLLTRFDAAALVPVVRGEQPLYVYVERASDIRSTLALKGEFPDLDLVLVGASEGWLVASEIAAAGVPVIADGLDDLPQNFEELGSTQSNIGRMVKAGVRVAINAAAMENPRNLNQYAGNLVALTRVPGADGLSWGQAFAAISSVPAAISGMDGRAGLLAPGALGDLVIWDDDPLEVGSMPLKVFIDGVEQPLENHQSRLRDRYLDLDTSDLPKAYDW